MRLLLIGMLALLAGCAEAQTQVTTQPKPQPATQIDRPSNGLETFLQATMQKHRIPGLQLAVVQHGKVVKLGAYGMANVEDSVPVTDQTVFPVHSITKAFTGVAVMQLVEAGKLDLAAPVSRYLDGLPAAWQGVTIRQLLTHASGIPDIWDEHSRMIADGDEASWAKVLTMPMEFLPGSRFKYNQTNYVLLGRVIDKLSGEPFVKFIKERQLEVAGMPLTGFGDAHDVVPHCAGSYQILRGADGAPAPGTGSRITCGSGLRRSGRRWGSTPPRRSSASGPSLCKLASC